MEPVTVVVVGVVPEWVSKWPPIPFCLDNRFGSGCISDGPELHIEQPR